MDPDSNQPRQSRQPFYESNLFWGCGGIASTIVLTVAAAMIHDFRWLLLLAWPLFCVSIWVATKNISYMTTKVVVRISCCVIFAFALYALNLILKPLTDQSQQTPQLTDRYPEKAQQTSSPQALQLPSETQKTPSLPKKTGTLPTPSIPAGTSTEKMITLHELFKTDFPHVMKMAHKVGYTSKEGKQSTFEYQIYMDYESKSKFMGIYIPISEPFSDSNKITYNICALVSYDFKNFINTGDKGVQIAFKNYGEQQTGNKDLTFSGRIFVYHEDNLSVEQIAELRKLYRENNLDVQFRGVDYLMFQNLSKRASQQSLRPTKRDP